MASDIDGLLEWLRKSEKWDRHGADVKSTNSDDMRIWHAAQADRTARWIAAVEQQRDALHKAQPFTDRGPTVTHAETERGTKITYVKREGQTGDGHPTES